MATRVILPDGSEAEIQIVDKTRPTADKEFVCAWNNSHTIAKGQRYVRCVYKLRRVGAENGEFYSDHICFDCWNQ